MLQLWNIWYVSAGEHMICCSWRTYDMLQPGNIWYVAAVEHMICCSRRTYDILQLWNIWYVAAGKHMICCSWRRVLTRWRRAPLVRPALRAGCSPGTVGTARARVTPPQVHQPQVFFNAIMIIMPQFIGAIVFPPCHNKGSRSSFEYAPHFFQQSCGSESGRIRNFCPGRIRIWKNW